LGNYIDSIIEKIEELKRRRRAVILAHNYQIPEVQEVADFVGDSLELSRKAMECSADVIVFAGVSFMAEMAAALNPDKIVLHPVPEAGCPLANFLPPSKLREYKESAPRAPIVVYVNSLASTKAEADYVVTSASAPKLISRLEDEVVIFGPDKNLADYVAELTQKEIVVAPPYGHCPVHEYLLNEYYVRKSLYEYPNAILIAHPETPKQVRRMAKFVGSTSQMIKAVENFRNVDTLVIATEEGLVYRARKLYPDKNIVPANPLAVCIDMKKITLRSILRALELGKHRVSLDSAIAKRVRETIERSLELLK